MSQLQDKQDSHFVRESLHAIASMMDFTGWLVLDGLVEGQHWHKDNESGILT